MRMIRAIRGRLTPVQNEWLTVAFYEVLMVGVLSGTAVSYLAWIAFR